MLNKYFFGAGAIWVQWLWEEIRVNEVVCSNLSDGYWMDVLFIAFICFKIVLMFEKDRK